MNQIDNIIDVMIEIPKNSNIKYEYDKENKIMRVDRILQSSMAYPANYGFFINTIGGDNDPLDALVISDYNFHPGTVLSVKIIGALVMEDEAGMDEKILTVPISKIDPSGNKLNNYDDLDEYYLQMIHHFFENYKCLEKNKWVKINEFVDKEKAEEIYIESINRYISNKV